jgi:hypothetical protein
MGAYSAYQIKTAPIARGRVVEFAPIGACCATSFSSEQPSFSQAPFSWLRSSSIDSPFTSDYAPLIPRARLCPLYKILCVESQEKNEGASLADETRAAREPAFSPRRGAPPVCFDAKKRSRVELF